MRRSLLLFFVALGMGCIDPVHADAVDALGPEAAGVRQGPTHRPGQPCLTCHGGDGPGEPDMSVGGTVYAVRGGSTALPGVTVRLTDAKGSQWSSVSNSVGNFYVFKEEWDPVFPLTVALRYGDESAEMRTPIGRDGGCATCHRGTGDARRMPAVYLRAQ